jgi:hypothetical protein
MSRTSAKHSHVRRTQFGQQGRALWIACRLAGLVSYQRIDRLLASWNILGSAGTTPASVA